MIRKLPLFLAISVLFNITNASAQNSSMSGSSRVSPTAIVTVSGYGATPSDARNDAIRQALQRTMQQLIVVDRVIKYDAIIRDKIMSTMNGYIENFKEIRMRKDGGQIVVDAEITVSNARIENFIGQGGGGSGAISGETLFANSQREQAQRQARGEIFDRLFRGFPGEALEVKIGKVSLSDTDPSIYQLGMNIKLSQAWLRSLKTGLKALASEVLTVPDNSGYSGRVFEDGRVSRDIFVRYNLNRDLQKTINGRHTVCLHEGSSASCFILLPGRYGGFPYIDFPLLAFYVRFVDDAGQSVIAGGNSCFVLDQFYAGKTRAGGKQALTTYAFPVQFLDPSRGNNIWHLMIYSAQLTSAIKSQQIDASRAKHVVAYPSFISKTRIPDYTNPITDIMSTGRQDICGEALDDAVRKTTMMQ